MDASHRVHQPASTTAYKLPVYAAPLPSKQYPTAQPTPSRRDDPYYGHQETAKTCDLFIRHLFQCPNVPVQATTTDPPQPVPSLARFIAYALHRTRLPPSVTYSALFLLSRLKGRFPGARGSSGHRLWISAFMIASKVVCDDTYSNKSWAIVGQHMFSLKEINQMEREMCGYLEWILNIDPAELKAFTDAVKEQYGPHSDLARQMATPERNIQFTRASASYDLYDDEDPGSPYQSSSNSPVSSTLNTPPSTQMLPVPEGKYSETYTDPQSLYVYSESTVW
ncbi:hypothetical protein DACRYDRAFT_25558 [Dacryopinax primogenitus]|uniref:Cyclin N-terminal domain-containing protein n=1 Tax=Dacryopinax primogenitus (strain DJM 731) TaxID=1858805 RepID=M5FU43_DACPD|nr:uncharacterized protein DACRYDRAFT_25558 [Dacryopinax primogenitus]EJT96746.1 hypothetical protein DACRYDRAFT_25558 [Dacryopinax primogenitus]